MNILNRDWFNFRKLKWHDEEIMRLSSEKTQIRQDVYKLQNRILSLENDMEICSKYITAILDYLEVSKENVLVEDKTFPTPRPKMKQVYKLTKVKNLL